MAIIAMIIAVVFLTLVGVFVGIPMVKLASDPAAFRAWVDEKGLAGKLIYFGMVILQEVIAFIPGEPFEIAAGYAFGYVEGTILSLVSSFAGNVLVFFAVRKYGTRLVEVFFGKDKLKSLEFLKISKKRNTLFLMIYMLPGTPKDLLNYYAGLTDIEIPAWLLICSFGRIPSIITSTIGGGAIGDKNYGFAIAVFAVTAIISIAGLAIYNRIQRKNDIDKRG